MDGIELERLFELSLDLLCVIGFDGNVRAVNPAVRSMLGYDPQDVVGRPALDLIHPDDRPQVEANMVELVGGNRIASFESRFRHCDGSWRHLLWNAAPALDDRVIYACCSDITERKEQSQRRFRRLFDTSKDGMVLANAVSGEITDVNPQFAAMSEYEAEELAGRNLADAPPFTADELGNRILRELRHSPTFRCESTLRQKHGGFAQVEVLSNRYPDDHHETIQCNIRDISDRKRAEAALRESDERFRLLVEGVRDYAVFMTDVEGRVVSWNGGAERILGYAEDEILGRSARIIFTPEDIAVEEPEKEMAMALSTGRSEDERWHRRKDGTRFFASGVLTALWNEDGGLRGFAKIMRDITEKKQNDEALLQAQKLESIGLLVGGIAHDFNNLLTAVMGNASLALEELPEDHRLRPMLAEVVNATRRAADLTRQLLAYAGKGRFVLDRMNLSDTVPEMLHLIRTSIPPAAQLKLELAGDLPAIEADPSQIQQIVMNLVINAGEAIQTQGEIRIRTGRREITAADASQYPEFANVEPGTFVFLEVADTGTGMDQTIQSKIFDPFFTTKFTGRGLGLAAVSGIVRSHRGIIHLASAPGEGTRFRVYFRAVSEPATPEKSAPDRASRGTGTILVADDEPLVQRTVTAALQRYGYKVLIAADGRQAVDLLRRLGTEIDLILLDLAMPVMSGEEAFPQLKRIRPEVPIVISSGYSEQIARERFGAAAVEAFIQKPYTGVELVQQIQSILSARSNA